MSEIHFLTPWPIWKSLTAVCAAKHRKHLQPEITQLICYSTAIKVLEKSISVEFKSKGLLIWKYAGCSLLRCINTCCNGSLLCFDCWTATWDSVKIRLALYCELHIKQELWVKTCFNEQRVTLKFRWIRDSVTFENLFSVRMLILYLSGCFFLMWSF